MTPHHRARPHRSTALALTLLGTLCSPIAARAAPAPTLRFNIAAGPLDRALLTYAAQSRRQVLFDREVTAGLTVPALVGPFTGQLALERLLAGTGIVAVETRPGVLVLKRPSSSQPTSRLDGASGGPAAGSSEVGTASEPAVVDALVVTGSLIRGPAPSASPVVSLTREGFDRAGQATLADALNALPQAFTGSSTPQTALIGSDGLGTNPFAATGVNLRGLGANSTLVLVNGRRLAGAGARGDFVDVSAIPTAAIDRVEVLLDGASALYGSDAVGGVVNVLLRTDFTGAETRIRLGGATQGGAGSAVLGQTFGSAWSTGRVVFSYEHERRDHLASSDRVETANADLRPLGGTDQRLFYSSPGNILSPTASGAYAPTYAIPVLAAGQALRPQDFLAGQANLENNRARGDILPNQARDSGYLSLSQDLTPRIHLSGDARYTRRDVDYDQPGSAGLLQVSRANPFFVAPNGATSEVIGYAYGRELGPIRASGDTESEAASFGATFDVGRTWRVDAYGDFAQEADHVRAAGLINTGFLNEALGNTADNPLTAYSAVRDGFFNPFGSGTSNSRAVLDFIGSGRSQTDTLSRVETFNVKADGVLFTLPGGEVKAALGAEVRRDLFKTSTLTQQSGPNPNRSGGITFGRTITAGFAELRVPLVGPANARPGLERLELSLAGRIENYEGIGVSGNPKLGLVWAPIEPLRLRLSYGTSFRAPALPELFATQIISPAILARGADQVITLVQYGGDAALKPESAVTWTGGADWRPPMLPGLVLSATVFDITYSDRIGQPVLENVANALVDPSFAPFVQAIDPAHNAADLARVSSLLAQSTSSNAKLFPATSYGAIADARFVNAASLHLRGADLSAAYPLTWGPNRFDLGFSATYLADYARRLTPIAPEVELAGTTGQPASLRVRTSASWTRGAYGASLALNHVSGSTPFAGPDVGSWTTLDTQLQWRPTSTKEPLRGLQLALNVANLFDTGPPFYNSPSAVAYDPANADPIGRTVSLQLVKRW